MGRAEQARDKTLLEEKIAIEATREMFVFKFQVSNSFKHFGFLKLIECIDKKILFLHAFKVVSTFSFSVHLR